MASLNKLLGKWKGEIPKEGFSSSIQLRTYKLYFKDILEFGVDDLRFMIIQETGSTHLVGLALDHLKEDILLEADYYEGDLLSSLLKLPTDFWKENESYYQTLKEMILANQEKLNDFLDLSIEVDRALSKAINDFIGLLNVS